MAFKDDIQLLFVVDQAVLTKLLEALKSDDLSSVKPKNLVGLIDQFLDSDSTDALIRIASSYIFGEQTGRRTIDSRFKDAILSSINDEGAKSFADLILELVNSRKLYLVVKAIVIPIDGGNVVESVRSVVDVRPIFERDRSNVVFRSIIPKIVFQYRDEDGEAKKIRLALDEVEIENVVDTLMEMVAKIKSLKDLHGHSVITINEEGFGRGHADEK
ncbi:MAG: hypothetical protein CML31_01615 [Rhizobiales bacterium]|nr:hypothetical protein [Hyphomicrobiales bacterium]|tara:strand:- start:1572 stop:2219 length:648 start_codon:yes stop_codon:yes gene_type:complete